MIFVVSQMVVERKKRDEFTGTLLDMLEPTRLELGCLGFRFYQDVENENAFALLEEWESRAALDRHIRTENYRVLLALTDLLSEPPEIRFITVEHTAGLEYAARILGLAGPNDPRKG